MISLTSVTTALACWAATHVASLLAGSGYEKWQRSRESAIQRAAQKQLEQWKREQIQSQVATLPPAQQQQQPSQAAWQPKR